MKRKDFKNQFYLMRDYCRLGYKGTLISMVGVSVLGGIRPYITLILTGRLTDRVYEGAAFEELLPMVFLMLGFVCVSSLAEAFLQQNYDRRVEYMYEQQERLTGAKCLSLDYECLEDRSVHEMLQHIQQAGTGYGLLGWVVDTWRKILQDIASILTAVIVILPLFTEGTSIREGFLSSWASSLLLIIFIGFLVYLNYDTDVTFGARIKRLQEESSPDQNRLRHYMGMFAVYDRQKDLRIYHQQETILRDTDAATERVDRAIGKIAGYYGKSELVKQTINALSLLLIYAFAGYRAFLGIITIGSVVTCASSMIQMSQALSNMMKALAQMRNTARYCEDYVRFMELKKRKHEGTIPVEKRRDNRFLVEFEHVSFRYPGSEEYVLRDLNLKFTIGERMAIVGKNGSGKTTFIKLLCRLYEATEGCIKVNGIDIRKYDYEEYCRLFAVVFQDFQMFAFPLGENIAGSGEVDEARAVDALNRAGLSEMLARLPEGLATFVGKEFDERGVSFSGGEKQKMAIARAIYKDAPFVIMDEPTAALDPKAECEVFAGFDRMVGNKTAIYISHRLASCRFCRDILVFDNGRVVQRGSHEELEAKEGLYRELWNAQAQYYR